eukprot:TRINITY_DN1453_c0_g2_i1.p1 TRINITY_DN1453_c0_g2~~TRINITY_DN1453_c0_g2_i1.p1  ORF type:complete len:651 (-),score=81.63 TRINITY_DN1453_c0_g2_i1:483-2312(-)
MIPMPALGGPEDVVLLDNSFSKIISNAPRSSSRCLLPELHGVEQQKSNMEEWCPKDVIGEDHVRASGRRMLRLGEELEVLHPMEEYSETSGSGTPPELTEANDHKIDDERLESSTSPAHQIGRCELLDIIRKHSEALAQPGVPLSSSVPKIQLDGSLFDDRYWKELFDMYFVRGYTCYDPYYDASSPSGNPFSSISNELIFACSQAEDDQPMESDAEEFCFVREWAPELDTVIGKGAIGPIDWRHSFYLNLIHHTSYTLTLAVCRRQDIVYYHAKPEQRYVIPVAKATGTLYASLVEEEQVDGLGKQAVLPEVAFETDEDFDIENSIDLWSADHCLVVLLHAHGGAAFPVERKDSKGAPGLDLSNTKKAAPARGSSNLARAFGDDRDGELKVTIFSGYVDYPRVRHTLDGGPLWSFLGGAPSRQEQRLRLMGPEGRGEADLGVVGLPVLLPQSPRAPLPAPHSPRPPGLDPMRLTDMLSNLQRVTDNLGVVVERSRDLKELEEQKKIFHADFEVEEKKNTHQLCLLQEELTLVKKQLKLLRAQEKLESRSEKEKDTSEALPQQPLRCKVFSVSLMWTAVAYDLLFKELGMTIDITGHVFPRRAVRTVDT